MSSVTKNSRAIREEIDYGINTNGLPVIVVYPEYSKKSDIVDSNSNSIKQDIKDLWNKLPMFRDSMKNVPTIHIPNKKSLIKKALEDTDFMVNSKGEANIYFYPL